jgi:hypothetical protein
VKNLLALTLINIHLINVYLWLCILKDDNGRTGTKILKRSFILILSFFEDLSIPETGTNSLAHMNSQYPPIGMFLRKSAVSLFGGPKT